LFNELRHKAAQLNIIFNPGSVMSDFEGTLEEVIKSEICIVLCQFE
jgi:hypothetical protein